MKSTEVEFYSEGDRIAAIWRTPDEVTGPLRAIVQGPGWLGLKDAKLYVRYHEALTAAGFGVLVFDYRGFGDSRPNPGPPRPDKSARWSLRSLASGRVRNQYWILDPK